MPKSVILIWQLLRKHISIFELAIFFVANLIGMTVILAGVQLYDNIRPLLQGEQTLIGSDYLVITHPVKRVGINSGSFTLKDIEDMECQEFIDAVGAFSASQFEVNGSIMFNGRKLSTMLFFESIPDEFIDVETDDWHFDDGAKVIPIILPRNYLNLYNFGFSATQQLPQITEDMIKSVSLGINLRGKEYNDDYTGRIVGFSDRLNTILVPDAFMSWANSHYADAEESHPTRLILKVADPTNPALSDYLEEHNYVIENKPAESSKALFILKVCIAIIICIGVLFSLLSIIILALSMYLLLQKNITKLENLVLIGYTPSRVAMPYNLITLVLNLSILAVSLVIIFLTQDLYMEQLSAIAGYQITTSPSMTIIVGVLFTALIIAFNFFIINDKIRNISRKR